MSSKRFWDETPADDSGADSAPGTPDPAAGDSLGTFGKHSPVTPGGESAIDPDTGEWRPKHKLQEFEIGGHTFQQMEGPMAVAQIHDADGNHLGSVTLPFDPADGEPDDAMLQDAMQTWHDLEHIRGMVSRDAIDGLANEIQQSRVDGQQAISEVMVSTVADALIEGVRITVTNDDDELTAAQLEELQAEVDRVFADTIPKAVEAVAHVPNPAAGGLDFWQQMAQDIIAHAVMYARDEVAETEYGRLEAAGQLEGAEGEAFDARVDERYKNGPYLAGAYMQGWQTWLPALGELARAALEYSSKRPADDPESMGARILDKARKNLGLPDASDAPAGIGSGGAPPRDIVPVFDMDGYGRRGNDLISRSAHKMFVSVWPGARTQAPAFEFTTGQGTVTYAVDRRSLADAWELVDSLGDAHADIFDYILAKMFAEMAAGTRDIYGDFTITPQEIYDALGYQKHHKGGYKGEIIREIVEKVEAMRQLQLQAAVKEKHNKNDVTYVHSVGLIAISETLTQVHTSGERYVVAWNLRPGNWARELESVSKQYAVTMQGILKLHGKRDKYAKRIGRYLLSQYRILANKRRAPMIRKVRTILEQSGIDLPTRNHARFRDQITRALDTLADGEQMRGPVCFMGWKYQKPIDWSASDWYVRWLDSNIEIAIPDAIMNDRYGSLEYTGKKPRQLSQGTPL